MSYKITRISDITEASIWENARKWLTIIRYGEYGVVIQPQDDCEYRVDQIINNPKILKEFLGPYYRKYLLKYVPIDNKGLTEAIMEELLAVCSERKFAIPKDLTKLKEIIDFIGKKGYEIGFFLSRINTLLEEPDFHSLLELEYLLENTLNLFVVVFSEKDLTHPKYRTLVDKCSLLFDHVSKFPLYSEADIRQFIKYNNSMWKMKLPKKLENQIIDSCGGYLWLISHIQRYVRDNPHSSIGDALKDEALLLKLESIFLKFTPKEQELILKSAEKSLTDADRQTHEYKYLNSIKMIRERNGYPTLGIPILSLIVEKEKNLRKIELREDKIFISGREIDGFLTNNEKNFLTLLISRQKKIILRDTLAKKLWGDSWEERYSDWAIDRLAYRVRRKMTQLGINEKLLKTVKRKGFIFG